ncbi:response regulator transcription factor, partial [Bacteroidota bacterium]
MNEKINILLAEDDKDLGNILSQFLEMHDFNVILARDGGEALELYNKNEVDICVLDIMMPVMDGFSLAQQIKKTDHEIPLLFLTAKSLKEDKIKGLKLGADDYICKPFEVEELVLRIQNILRRTNKTQAETYIIGKSEFSFKDLKITTPDESYQMTVKEAELL